MNRFLRLSLIGNASVYVLGLISLTFSMGAARADITRDLQNQRPLLVIFQNATADGMTIEAAVTAAMRALPDRAGDIVAAAVLLIPALPSTACPAQSEAEARHWQSLCERQIVQAALAAGADPSVVTTAAAAGRVSAFVPVVTEAPRLRPETAVSPLQLPNSGSGALPSGGSGGGGIASPS